MNGIVQKLYEFFIQYNYQWRIDGELKTPSQSDIELLIQAMYNDVSEDVASISIESGKILVKNTDGHIDCWVWIGEF